MAWIALSGIGTIILACLLAPVFETRIQRRVAKMLIAAGLLLALGIVTGHAGAMFVLNPNDREAAQVFGIFEALTTGLGLFFLVIAAVRFATAEPPQA